MYTSSHKPLASPTASSSSQDESEGNRSIRNLSTISQSSVGSIVEHNNDSHSQKFTQHSPPLLHHQCLDQQQQPNDRFVANHPLLYSPSHRYPNSNQLSSTIPRPSLPLSALRPTFQSSGKPSTSTNGQCADLDVLNAIRYSSVNHKTLASNRALSKLLPNQPVSNESPSPSTGTSNDRLATNNRTVSLDNLPNRYFTSSASTLPLHHHQQQNSPRLLTTTLKRSMYVRTLFAYNADKDSTIPIKGLSFNHGDILYVVNASNPEWWQARRLSVVVDNLPAAADSATIVKDKDKQGSKMVLSSLGVIPGRNRLERRHRVKAKRVNFFGAGAGLLQSSGTSFRRFATTDQPLEDGPADYSSSYSLTNAVDTVQDSPRLQSARTFDGSNSANNNANSKKRSSSLSRAIVRRFSSLRRNTGQSRNNNNSSQSPLNPASSTTTCSMPDLNDTSRPPQASEIDGVDYHFVKSPSLLTEGANKGHFVGLRQLQPPHWTAFSLDLIRQLLQLGRICILDVDLRDIDTLQRAGLHPLTILVKPNSVECLQSVQRRLTDEQASKTITFTDRVEDEYWSQLTAIITYNSVQHAVECILQAVAYHSGPVIWTRVDSDLSTVDYSTPPPSSHHNTLPNSSSSSFGLSSNSSSTMPRSMPTSHRVAWMSSSSTTARK